MLTPFEALMDAIIHYNGYNDPTSVLYKNRNPGGLRPLKVEQMRDDHGYRVFKSVLDGYQALKFDLSVKLTGRLSPDSDLVDLATAYGQKPTVAQAWARFLKQALADNTITAHTSIRRFIEEQ